MPRAPLLPDVADGLGSMPPGEALLVSLKLITSLVAGVSFLGFRARPCAPGQPGRDRDDRLGFAKRDRS